ncbi:Fimbrial assembly family protein [Methylobacterium sp. 4-46]|uniref:PilN domain-containing protein n=1 Tax=unclassified Methylobacterium TaxID=2615210 RepID=UPI000152E26C|nr:MULTISPECIES: PilN domain-containing protein [Methylobacterium]ACA16491.1 Fimbrial assembly family protein [Methylobacterium sp. 4-46]WFT82201.1 PilN domain-containing protein [Methylobacterium nodulans]
MALALPWIRHAGPPLRPLRDLLAALLDEAVRRLGPVAARLGGGRRVVVVEEDALLVYGVARGGEAVLAARLGPGEAAPERLRGGPLEARLPAGCFLRRSLSVPEAGRAYLRPIIEHRLERLTPWQPDRVLYGFRVAPPAPGGDVTVDLLVTARERAEPLLARVAAAGLRPTALGSAEEPLAAPLAIDLYAGRAEAGDPVLRRRLGRGLAGALALLALACAGTAWLAASAEAELQATEERLAALQARVQARTRPRASRAQALLAANRPEAGMGSLLDRLSAALPDHTVLRELDAGRGTLHLLGRSADAPALVGLLETQAGLSGLRFAAPVVRDGEGRDLFDLAATRAAPPGGVP